VQALRGTAASSASARSADKSVQESIFESGKRVVVNFGQELYADANGNEVERLGFRISLQ